MYYMFKDIGKKKNIITDNNCWLGFFYYFRENSLFRDLKGEWVDMAALANNITLKAIKLLNVLSMTDYSKVCSSDHKLIHSLALRLFLSALLPILNGKSAC